MQKTGKIKVQWGHLALLAVLGTVILAYLLDARATSLRTNNLILVQPMSILALILLLMVLPQCFQRVPPADAEEDKTALPAAPKETPIELAKIGVVTGAFILLAFFMEQIGFDIAVFSFLVLGIFVCGERNWIANIAFSAVFTALLIYGYGAIIPFPFPLAVL
jgi:hypothetical protein